MLDLMKTIEWKDTEGEWKEATTLRVACDFAEKRYLAALTPSQPTPDAGEKAQAERIINSIDCPQCRKLWEQARIEYEAGGSPQSPPIFCTHGFLRAAGGGGER